MLQTAKKWPVGRRFAGLPAATLPQLFYGCVQENYWHARRFKQFSVARLDKSAASQRYYPCLRVNSLEHVLQRAAFGTPESWLTGLAKYLGDSAAFAALDAIVQIFKNPIQPSP
jgi:hypothetical protein